MPKKIQEAAAAIALEKEYGVLGKLGLAVDEIIVPTALVANLVQDNKRPWAIGAYTGAVAAQYAAQGIQNPAGSGALVYVDRIQFGNLSTCGVALIHDDSPGPGVSATPFFTDRRDATAADAALARPRVELLSGNLLAGVSGNAIGRWVLGNAGGAFFKDIDNLGIVLREGNAVVLGITDVVNVDFNCTWRGRIELLPRTSR